MLNLDALEAAVAVETTSLDSFIVFVQNLKDQLAAELADDPAAQAKIDAFMTELQTNQGKMAAAMAANVA